jgi:vacuolar-type H+-ATPase subunit I/STV1
MGRRAFFLVQNDQEREVARLEDERNELRAAVSCEKQGRAEAEHALAKAEALIEKTARELEHCLKDVKLLDAHAAAATDKAHKLEVDLGKVRKAIGSIRFNEIVG